ncbi:PRD domain-containing protein [Paenactinomyces guangxiensis]|uniref:PRD domain-containing protein n=1 Tax=Paenactinomyces guangxiensis TaxID=1490290 RepID=A0A7W1WPX6_9BACL|nr:PRD domain-containing protein [Paenactinomyces guangxiensis]MBA4493902.1 PRD domain-containing protein [Paenactinomyces guangxiensis]MBH8591368.1 PRD domain-containing protein [Paenactinomyces guangxiensis]
MIDQLIQEISQQNPLVWQEKTELTSLLFNIKKRTEQISLSLSQERWMAVAVHLLAFIKRMEKGESLPPIEAEVWEEVSDEMKEVSRLVLEAYGHHNGRNICNTEILLLALHFETAKMEQQGE